MPWAMSVIACIVITLFVFVLLTFMLICLCLRVVWELFVYLWWILLYVYVLSFMSHPIINILYMISVQQYRCSIGSWNLRQSFDHYVVFLLIHKYITKMQYMYLFCTCSCLIVITGNFWKYSSSSRPYIW